MASKETVDSDAPLEDESEAEVWVHSPTGLDSDYQKQEVDFGSLDAFGVAVEEQGRKPNSRANGRSQSHGRVKKPLYQRHITRSQPP